MTTRPGYVWDKSASEWVSIGPVALPGSKISYQTSAPTSPATGDIWVDADDEVPGITSSLNYRWRKIATGGETSLSGVDGSGLPLAYNPGYEQVYLNGVLLYRGSDYTATTGNTITGLTALVAGDTIEVLSFVTAPIGDTYTQAAADGKFQTKVNNGLNLVIPTSVAGGTVSANGAVTIGSAVGSVTVNGAFSSTYDNYKIITSSTGTSSNTAGVNLQLGSTTSGYKFTLSYTAYGTASTTVLTSASATSHQYAGVCYTTEGLIINLDVVNPFLTKRTQMMGFYIGLNESGWTTGLQDSTTSFTSFTITPQAGTMTGGTIRIYGYNNGA